MDPAFEFYTIEKPAIAEHRERGSRFIAYAFPLVSVPDFKEKLATVKKEHPKATHHCFAYRLGTEGTIFRVSDDGEPAGTAGRPILGQIDSLKLTNVLVIVVRYFGGTLLGVPGLITAYKTTASLALQVTPVVIKPLLVNYRLEFDYTLMNEVMRLLKHYDCVINARDFQLFCRMEIAVPKKILGELLSRLNEITGVTATALT